jgi:hypothetical protein
MSSPATPYQPTPFIKHVLLALLPHFKVLPAGPNELPEDIIETLQSYGARSRAEILHAALILAFSLSALDTLAQARSPDLSPSLRLRYRVCANALNRAAQQNATALNKRFACDLPTATSPAANPAEDLTDAQVDAMIQQARAQFDACRNRLANPQAAATPARQTKRPRDSILANLFAETPQPDRPAA